MTRTHGGSIRGSRLEILHFSHFHGASGALGTADLTGYMLGQAATGVKVGRGRVAEISCQIGVGTGSTDSVLTVTAYKNTASGGAGGVNAIMSVAPNIIATGAKSVSSDAVLNAGLDILGDDDELIVQWFYDFGSSTGLTAPNGFAVQVVIERFE